MVAGDALRGGAGRGSTRGAWRAHLQTWPGLGSLKREPTVKGSVDPSEECVLTLHPGRHSQAVTRQGLFEKEHSSSWAADGPVRGSDRSRCPSKGRQGSAGLGSGANPAVASGGSESAASCYELRNQGTF